MKYILLIGVIIFLCIIPEVRVFLLNPIKSIYNSIIDVFKYFKYKKYNNYNGFGQLNIFCGLFGKGKSLSMVKYLDDIYKHYNNLDVWNNEKKVFEKQTITILTNLELYIPHLKLYQMSDILKYIEDKSRSQSNILIVAIDEMSTQLNSRDFKNNFNNDLLNLLLTCRHYKIEIVGTSQRFNHVDALVRQVTSNVIEVNKIWRGLIWRYYDAYALENCNNPLTIQPKFIKTHFVLNKHYALYNTLAVVENFKDNFKKGLCLTDSEILENRNINYFNAEKIDKKGNRRKIKNVC